MTDEDYDYCVPGPLEEKYYFRDGEFIALIVPDVVIGKPPNKMQYHKVYFRINTLVIDDKGFRSLLTNPFIKVERNLTIEEKAYIYERLP